MTESLALGAALYFDAELAVDPSPFVRIVDAVAGARTGLTQWTNLVADKSTPPPKPFDLAKLVHRITSGEVRSAAVETAPRASDEDQVLILARTAPASEARRFSLSASMYELQVVVGAKALRDIGAARVVDAVIEFANHSVATAGIVVRAETSAFAGAIATGGGSSRLTAEQGRYISEMLVMRSQWGTRIRGPAWGTFLSKSHVDALGGMARVERESGCARVMALTAGGAYLQASSIDDPMVAMRDDDRIASLARFLASV